MSEHDEVYGLSWPGKHAALVEADMPSHKNLILDNKTSIDPTSTENLFIEGDSLDALKILQGEYVDRVKMVYIDPPYNTGKDFLYRDTMSHGDWLNMMYPRLVLAHRLLRGDGVLFISIDDNEVENLVLICKEIFGESFVEKFIWEKVGDGDAGAGKMKVTKRHRIDHEYIVVCRKSDSTFKRRMEVPSFKNVYGNPDNDPRGPYKAGNMSKSEVKSNPNGKNYYSVTAPGGRVLTRQWHVDSHEFARLQADNRIYWGKRGSNVPAVKIFVNEPRELVNSSILKGLGSAVSATKRLRELFDGKNLFDNPKPTQLIERLLYLQTESDDIILDFFAGSSTTAHAVMRQNAMDGGKRKWIMVQTAEKTDKTSEAYKAGYETIAALSRERIRRAGEAIRFEHPQVVDDYGFRSLRIDPNL